MTTKNPWLGLASYDEPKGKEEDRLFCGRDEETMDIVRLIENNLFITLYGSSGIGKTSLLKAGVIPILKRKDYFPLYVRLSQESNEISYAEAIVRHLKKCGLTEESHVALEHADGNDRLFLWNYFATTRFLDAEGREIYPVIILDQFEEVFRDADKAKAELLLQQIYLLLNDELEMPDAEGYSADTNYRFVASIREDYLFVLEDSIDELSLDLYKTNRYRLRPMKPENAQQVVLIPGRDCIEESEKEKIADRVLELAKKPQSDDIDTLLLSLVCAGTFDKKMGEKITFGDLSIWKNNPMQIYYKDAMRGLNANQIRYIQQHLIREDGSRKRVSVEALKAALGENDFQELTKGKNRLFSIGDKGQVELLHDKLAMAVYEERKAFEERERKKKFRRRVSVIGVVILAIAGVFFFQNAKLKQQRWKMLESQSKLVANKVIDLASDDSYTAQILALEILPKKLSHPNRPYSPEAEKALRKACEYNSAVFRANGINGEVVLSPDAKLIVTSQITNSGDVVTIKTWDIMSGAIKNTLKLRANGFSRDGLNIRYFYNPRLSKDGRYFAVNKHQLLSNTLMVYEIATGRELISMENKYKDTRILAFSDDGERIATLSKDSTLLIRSTATGETIMKAVEPFSHFNFASFSPDGKLIALTSSNNLGDGTVAGRNVFAAGVKPVFSTNTITIWNIETQEKINTWQGHNNIISSVSFSPDGNQILTSSYDGFVKIWETQTGKELSTSSKVQWALNQANFSPDGKQVVASSQDGSIHITDAVTGEETNSLLGHTSSVVSAIYSYDGNIIVSFSQDNTIRKWDINHSNHSTIMAKTIKPVYNISPDLEHFGLRYDDTTLLVKNLNDCEKTTVLHLGKAYNLVSYSPDGKSVITNYNSSTIKIWDIESGKVTNTLTGHNFEAYSFDISPDGKKVAAALMNSHLGIWELDHPDQPVIQQRYGSLSDASFSPDGKLIYLPSCNTRIDIIDANHYRDKKPLVGHNNFVQKVAFCPNNNTIVSTSSDNTLRIWNPETQECLKVLTGHTAQVNRAAFSPDGKLVASASSDNTIRVWDVASGGCIQILEEHTAPVYFVAFTPDGRHLISAAEDCTIRKWDFPPLQELIDQTRERFKDRPLTDEERKTYYLE